MLAKFIQAIDKDLTFCTRLNTSKKHGALTAFRLVLLRNFVAIFKLFVIPSNLLHADFWTIRNAIHAYIIGLINNLTSATKNRNGAEVVNPASQLTLNREET
jgi:hypothetical protein